MNEEHAHPDYQTGYTKKFAQWAEIPREAFENSNEDRMAVSLEEFDDVLREMFAFFFRYSGTFTAVEKNIATLLIQNAEKRRTEVMLAHEGRLITPLPQTAKPRVTTFERGVIACKNFYRRHVKKC